MTSSGWTVARRNSEVRIDVTDAYAFAPADAQGIIDAVEQHLDQDGVRTVRFGGPVLEAGKVSERLGRLIGHLAQLVERRGLYFFLGPV